MPTVTPIAYNTGASIPGTEQYGTLAVGTSAQDYGAFPGGYRFWATPDQDLGYVIAKPVPAGNQPNPVAVPAYIGFSRTQSLDEGQFVDLANSLTGNSFTSGSQAKIWLESNGYWTSYSEPSIVTSGLFMELDAANYTSGLWLDETGNGNNGTVNGATWSSTDGGIFDLDGLNDTISIPHTSNLSLNTSTQRTIQVWVKFDVLPASNVQVPVFGKLSSSFSFDGYWGGLFSNGGAVRCVTNGSSAQKISTSVSTISIDTWYLFTFISQITATAGTTKVYINETQYISTEHGSDTYTESNPLYLGWIGSGVSSAYLNGKIGACYFYTKGLDSSEISQNFNATKARFGL